MAGAKVGGEGCGLGAWETVVGTTGGGGGIRVSSGGGVGGGGGTREPAGAAASTGTGIGTDTGGTGKNEKGFNKYRFPQRSNMQGAGRGSRMFSGFCNRLRSMLARSGTWRPIMLQMCICHIRRMAKHLEEHMAVIQCIIRGMSAKRNRIFKAHKLCALNIRFVLLTYL